jgi:hypothetical protein
MKTSPEEAFDLLRKWFTERTPLTVLLVVPTSELAVKVSGFINGLNDDILISDFGTASPNDPIHNHIIFPARLTESYEYAEAKDLPFQREYFAAKHGPANLRIVLNNGISISFFESPISS